MIDKEYTELYKKGISEPQPVLKPEDILSEKKYKDYICVDVYDPNLKKIIKKLYVKKGLLDLLKLPVTEKSSMEVGPVAFDRMFNLIQRIAEPYMHLNKIEEPAWILEMVK